MQCVGFLQMMYVHSGIVRDEVMEQFNSMNIHDDLDNFLEAAGFVVPDNDVCCNLSHQFFPFHFRCNDLCFVEILIAGWMHKHQWRSKDDAK
jgi:hypothetical protein